MNIRHIIKHSRVGIAKNVNLTKKGSMSLKTLKLLENLNISLHHHFYRL